jgi:hypothetical protein
VKQRTLAQASDCAGRILFDLELAAISNSETQSYIQGVYYFVNSLKNKNEDYLASLILNKLRSLNQPLPDDISPLSIDRFSHHLSNIVRDFVANPSKNQVFGYVSDGNIIACIIDFGVQNAYFFSKKLETLDGQNKQEEVDKFLKEVATKYNGLINFDLTDDLCGKKQVTDQLRDLLATFLASAPASKPNGY